MNGDKCLQIIIVSLFVMLTIIVTGATFLTYRHDEKMAELGFQETCLPGRQSPVWQKVPQAGGLPVDKGGTR